MNGGRRTDSPIPDPDYCHYATRIFLPLLMQLENELQGVIRDDDPEYVHRSRVATRRIRAAFPLFEECFPAGKRKKWEKSIRVLTRSLGEARDLDVQIEVVRSVLAERNHEDPSGHLLFSSAEPLLPQPPATKPASPAPRDIRSPLPLRTRIGNWIRNRRLLPGQHEPSSERKTAIIPLRGDQIRNFLPDDPVIPGLECLLLRLIQQRQVLQSQVTSVASGFLSGGTIGSFSRFLQDLRIHSMLRGEGIHQFSSYEIAYLQIMGRVADLFWYEPYLGDPSMQEKHHAMRIMAKKLRYTIEAFAGLYDDSLKGELKVIKKLQELLGDIHDCDVWAELLPRFLEEEKGRSKAFFGNNQFFGFIRPGIVMLTEDLREKRSSLFGELCHYWEQLKDDRFWDDLSAKVSLPLQTPVSEETGAGTSGPVTIALISDVHANLPALEAVLSDAGTRGASVIVNAGDMIGYGPFPDDVVSLIRDRHIMSVIGNYDLSVLSKRWKRGKPRSREKQVAMQWAYKQLSEENRRWLKRLPRVLRLPVRGMTLMVTHGSPDSVSEYLDDGTPETRLSEVAAGVNARVVVTGHSHRPSAREINGVWFVNTGSVGRSEDGDNRACYALITVDPFSLTHIRVPYDISRTIDAIHKCHLPEVFARIILEGRSLDTVRKPGNGP